MRALRRNRQRLVMPQSRQLTELASLLKSHISAEQKGNMVLFLTWLAEGKGEGVVCAQTLEIPAQFLALPPIPHVTLSRSLNLFALHFPSAKFGERSPPRCLRWQLGGRHCSCSVCQKMPGLRCVERTIKQTVHSDLGMGCKAEVIAAFPPQWHVNGIRHEVRHKHHKQLGAGASAELFLWG